MKSISIKIASISLAFLVVFSTFSFAVEKHFCGDFLVDISFTGDAQGCEMQKDKDVSIKGKGCCKDEVHQIHGQDELQQNSVDKFDFQKKQFLTAFLISYKDAFVEVVTKNNHYKDFSPPDIPVDYQVLYQTFLI